MVIPFSTLTFDQVLCLMKCTQRNSYKLANQNLECHCMADKRKILVCYSCSRCTVKPRGHATVTHSHLGAHHGGQLSAHSVLSKLHFIFTWQYSKKSIKKSGGWSDDLWQTQVDTHRHAHLVFHQNLVLLHTIHGPIYIMATELERNHVKCSLQLQIVQNFYSAAFTDTKIYPHVSEKLSTRNCWLTCLGDF